MNIHPNAWITGTAGIALIVALLFFLAPQIRDSSAGASGSKAAASLATANDVLTVQPMRIVPADPLSPDGISSTPLTGDGSN